VARSYVVTGAGRGIGRAIAERVLGDVHCSVGPDDHPDAHTVVVLDRDAAALDWVRDHPASARLVVVAGDASDEAVVANAADLAEAAAPLAGWVNNAAVFRDAWLHEVPARRVIDLIALNLDPVVVGCATAIRRFLAAGSGGAIVNVSSHQAQRAVRGALRRPAVPAGSGRTRADPKRLSCAASARADRPDDGGGRRGGYLLSDQASFVNGVLLHVDGGRAAQRGDPEEG
jgi:NAD(P)-dependent dehydrogenase (short-subunit alcohol dehydrogenase family)